MEPLLARLAEAPPRTRRLLLALGAATLALAAGALVVLPLSEARRDTARALSEAEALYRWIHARAEALPAGALAAAPDAIPTDPVGIGRLESTLVAAGLRDRATRIANRPGGGVEIAFDAVPFGAFIGWLDGGLPGWGYRIADLTLRRGETGGEVSALLRLDPAR